MLTLYGEEAWKISSSLRSTRWSMQSPAAAMRRSPPTGPPGSETPQATSWKDVEPIGKLEREVERYRKNHPQAVHQGWFDEPSWLPWFAKHRSVVVLSRQSRSCLKRRAVEVADAWQYAGDRHERELAEKIIGALPHRPSTSRCWGSAPRKSLRCLPQLAWMSCSPSASAGKATAPTTAASSVLFCC